MLLSVLLKSTNLFNQYDKPLIQSISLLIKMSTIKEAFEVGDVSFSTPSWLN